MLKLSFVYVLAALAAILPAFAAAELVTETEQFGTTRLEFEVSGAKAFLIPAIKPAADGTKPWVWYAPTFFGRHPDPTHEWMAKQLLEAGFAIGGIEVGESYGSPAGRTLYTDYYQHVVREYGLDAQACLLPQSRGGLMLLNWAVEHPEKVRCIAGIYTVCNLESYPGLEKATPAYEMDAATLKSKLAEHNPIERLAPLAAKQVPVLFVHGDSDKTVPLEANAGELVARYVKLGGPGKLITVPGKGHEAAPEFFQNQEFLDFLLRQGKEAPGES